MIDDTKICPECAESVRAEAKICRHCGHTFGSQEDSIEVSPTKKGGMLKKGLGCLGIVLVLLVLIGVFAPKDSTQTPATNDAAAIATNSNATDSPAGSSSQKEASTPAAPVAPEAGLTQANFERIRDGMTVEEVAAILGSPGEKVTETSAGGSTFTNYKWQAGILSGKIVVGSFDNGKLMSKTQTGL